MDKKIIVKKGSRVEIEISRREPEKINRKTGGGGLIRPRRESEYQARRRLTGGINFYDLGQIKNSSGAWISNSVYLAGNFEIFGDRNVITDETDAQKLAAVGDLEAEVFAVATADYQSKFYKINKSDAPFEKSIEVSFERAGDYIFENLNQAAEWKTVGLALNQSQVNNLSIYPQGQMYAINVIDFANLSASINRVTVVRDSSAPNVSFTPSPKMEVFLLPALMKNYGYVFYKDGLHTFTDSGGTHSDLISRADHLNYFRSVLPRGLWADFVSFFETQDGLSNYQQNYRFWQLLKQFPNARARRVTYDFHEFPPYSYFSDIANLSVADYPLPAIYTDTDDPTAPASGRFSESYGAYFSNDVYDLQKLKFIIRKNNQLYYFWFI